MAVGAIFFSPPPCSLELQRGELSRRYTCRVRHLTTGEENHLAATYRPLLVELLNNVSGAMKGFVCSEKSGCNGDMCHDFGSGGGRVL